MVELIRFRSRRRAEELRFILRGGGIACALRPLRQGENGHGTRWLVLVPAPRLDEARQVLREEGIRSDELEQVEDLVAERREQRRPGLHWVVGLVVVNLLVWIAMEGQGGSEEQQTLLRFGASQAPLLLQGQWWRIVTAVFIHIGLRHLLSNMFALSVLGPSVLRAWGVGRFYTMYLLAGVAGNLVSFAISPTSAIKAGASGAILGLLGMLAGARIRSLRAADAPTSRFKTWHIIAMLVAFYGFVIGSGDVDHLAHIGGLVVGLLLALMMPPPGRLGPRADRALGLLLGGAAMLATAGCGLLAYLRGWA